MSKKAPASTHSKTSVNYRHFLSLFARVLAWVWPLLVLLAATSIELAHIATSSWEHFFLYDGDSLTLPMVAQSIARDESFRWIFSSQIFLFPEGLLYAVSDFITSSVRASLVCNAILNVLILYALLLAISRTALPGQKLFWHQAYALGCSLLFIGYTLLERSASINGASVATLYMFTTYYYGVIISGLLLVWLVLLLLKNGWVVSRRLGLLLFASVGVIALTVVSNPLFVVQVTLPLCTAVAVLFLLKRLSWRDAGYILAIQLAGIVAGLIIRIPFERFIASGMGRYVRPDNIDGSLAFFRTTITQISGSVTSSLEYLIAVLVMATVLIRLGILLNRSRVNKAEDTSILFLVAFAACSAVLLIPAMIGTGTTTTRYFLPIFIFPLVGLVGLIKLPARKLLAIVAVISAICVVAACLQLNNSTRLLAGTAVTGQQCLKEALQGKPAYGVGSYWSSRPLDVYASSGERVLQVSPGLGVYPWLNNLAAYKDKSFTFIVVERTYGPSDINQTNVQILEPPSRIHSCADRDIYLYNPGSIGYQQLNSLIAHTLAAQP